MNQKVTNFTNTVVPHLEVLVILTRVKGHSPHCDADGQQDPDKQPVEVVGRICYTSTEAMQNTPKLNKLILVKSPADI